MKMLIYALMDKNTGWFEKKYQHSGYHRKFRYEDFFTTDLGKARVYGKANRNFSSGKYNQTFPNVELVVVELACEVVKILDKKETP